MELEEHDELELDLPPEYCHYRDEGCDLAASCLNCPFAGCIYDEPGGRQRWLKRLRTGEMARLFTTEGRGIRELALIFGVSRRTVQRALKVALGDSTKRGVQNVNQESDPANVIGRLQRPDRGRSIKDE